MAEVIVLDSDKTSLMTAIGAHLQEYGAGSWKELQGRFPHVAPATFWRYVRKARNLDTDRLALGEARQLIADHVAFQAPKPADRRIVGEEIPSIASGWKQLNLLGQLERAFADIDLLRSYARSEDGKINFPHFFAQTISMRDRTVTTALRCAESIWDVQRMLDFFDVLVEEVASESPEVAQRITQRLRDMAKERGIG